MKQETQETAKKTCEKGCKTVVLYHTLIVKMSDSNVKIEFYQCEECPNKTIYLYRDNDLVECFDLE